MDKERFQRLVRLYIDGRLTPAEEEDFYREILKEENQTLLAEALKNVWQTQREHHSHQPPTLEGYRRIKRIMRRLPAYRIRKRRWWAVACVMLAILCIGVWVSVRTISDDRPVITVRAVQGMEDVALPDGTLVQLREGSELTYHDQFLDARDVTLRGEAFFDVAKDKKVPFLLRTGEVTTEVLGTAFQVKAIRADKTQVTVFRGRVRVTAGGLSEILTKNDQIDYDNGAFQLRRLAETPGNQDFHITNKPLAFLTAILSNRFDVRFHFADPGLKDHMITTTFSTDDSLQEILEIIALVDKLQWRAEGDEIFLSKTNI